MMGRGMMGNGMMMGGPDMGYGMGMMGMGGCGMMGPGMMGPGMMGPGMMGPGMMGPGMMGPGMMGPGMMGMGVLDLDQGQRAQIAKIQQDARKKHWDLMAQLNQEQYKLQELYLADKRDPKAIGDEYRKIGEIQRQMVEAWVDSQNRIEGALTEEQKETLRTWGHGPGMMRGQQR
jgi:Spy/CpxP family protein refolding chaperone